MNGNDTELAQGQALKHRSLQTEAKPKFTTPDGTSLSCQIPSLVDENLNESWLAGRVDNCVVAWFALAALLTPASLHCLAAVLP